MKKILAGFAIASVALLGTGCGQQAQDGSHSSSTAAAKYAKLCEDKSTSTRAKDEQCFHDTDSSDFIWIYYILNSSSTSSVPAMGTPIRSTDTKSNVTEEEEEETEYVTDSNKAAPASDDEEQVNEADEDDNTQANSNKDGDDDNNSQANSDDGDDDNSGSSVSDSGDDDED